MYTCNLCLSKNEKNINIFQLKIVMFYSCKNCCILQRRVILMELFRIIVPIEQIKWKFDDDFRNNVYFSVKTLPVGTHKNGFV